MTKPNPAHHNTRPEYARDLVHYSRMTQEACALAIGISESALKKYINGSREMSYPTQYTLEQLVASQDARNTTSYTFADLARLIELYDSPDFQIYLEYQGRDSIVLRVKHDSTTTSLSSDSLHGAIRKLTHCYSSHQEHSND